MLLLKDPIIVEVSPDRSNIYFEVRERPARGESKIETILQPIIAELDRKKIDMELTLVYGNLETCADCFMFFSTVLGKEQYYPSGAEPLSKNRLFSQYHAEYPQHEKERVVKEMVAGKCKARVLFVTVAFGMGIDIPNIRKIVHVGVPHTMEEYFQESGRAGRDGAFATATMYFNAYDIMKRKTGGIDVVMRDFVTTKKCRRKVIMTYFGHDLSSRTLHSCCDNCKAVCDCSDCLLAITEQIESMACVSTLSETASEQLEILAKSNMFSATDKANIRADLEEYRSSLYKGKSCVGGITLTSGFSLELIDETVERCEELVSIEVIQDTLPVYCKKNAEVIFSILNKYNLNNK